MLHYLLALLAVLLVVGGPLLESLTTIGPNIDYLVASGVALLLKPWLENQLG